MQYRDLAVVPRDIVAAGVSHKLSVSDLVRVASSAEVLRTGAAATEDEASSPVVVDLDMIVLLRDNEALLVSPTRLLVALGLRPALAVEVLSTSDRAIRLSMTILRHPTRTIDIQPGMSIAECLPLKSDWVRMFSEPSLQADNDPVYSEDEDEDGGPAVLGSLDLD
jgi:hypothetical protein